MAREAERLDDLGRRDIALEVERNLREKLAQRDGSELNLRFGEVVCMGEYVVVSRAGYEVPTIGGDRRLTCVYLLSAS